MGVTYTTTSAETYEPIQTYTLTDSSTTSFNFASIPSTYTDLILVLTGAATSGGNSVFIRLNNDTNGNNYGMTEMGGNGTTSSTTRRVQNNGWVFWTGMSTSFDNVMKLEISNYATTVGYKTALLRNNTGTNFIEQLAGSWASTAAINRIEIYTASGAFTSGTTATLYGIKAA